LRIDQEVRLASGIVGTDAAGQQLETYTFKPVVPP
jgi:hypothetical protein